MTFIAFVNLLFAMLFHWLVDFVSQSDYMAKNKSSNNKVLFSHSLIYGIGVSICFTTKLLLAFPVLLISHFVIDYFTSRLAKSLFEKGDRHNFFVCIGFDQFLHFIIILILVFICYN